MSQSENPAPGSLSDPPQSDGGSSSHGAPEAPEEDDRPAPVATVPQLASGLATGSLSSFTFSITVPDLRNGSLVNIQQAAPKAAMSALYHWPVISKLPAAMAVDAVEHMIRSAYAQMTKTLGAQATAANMVEWRKKAIVIGSIRAGAASAFSLASVDMLHHETVNSGMAYDATRKAIVQDAGGSTSNTRWTSAQSMTAITVDEQQVVAICIYMGMAVPALQGVSLVMTGHHYIPTTYNLFKGLKRQALGNVNQAARTWIEAMGENFDDMAFHKACHTISPTLKRTMSKKPELAARFRASGHGSAAIRLPALPSEASGGKAAVALVRSAASTIAMMKVPITADIGEKLLRDLDEAEEGPAEAAACDRVVAWVNLNQQNLAFCAGVVQTVHESTGTGRNTLLAAYSIKRLMSDNPADVNRGIIFARAAAVKQRDAMEKGDFSSLSFAM